MGAVIRNNRGFRLGVSFLDRFDLLLGHIHRAEYKINTRCNFLYIGYILYHKFLNRPRHRACHLPSLSHCLLVGLAGASFARRNSHNLKPRMVFKQCNKTLPHHSGRT